MKGSWKTWTVVALVIVATVVGAMVTGDYINRRSERQAEAREAASRREFYVHHYKTELAHMLGAEQPGVPEGCKLVRRAQAGMKIAHHLQGKPSMEPRATMNMSRFSIALADSINNPGGDVTPPITFTDLETTESAFDADRKKVNIEAGIELLPYIMHPYTGPNCEGTMYDFRDSFVAAIRLANILESVEVDANALGTTRTKIEARLLRAARSEIPGLKASLKSEDALEVVEAKRRIKVFMSMFGFSARKLRLGRADMERYIAHGYNEHPLDKL